uniref:C3H1-type domain-containing protein n=1 Tax=Panagrolaimus sp. JU765 TaxID=591449 RepID=A0AC34RQD0_9BILA
MPPKKAQGPSKKEVEKKKQKIIEDKTFGMKNKNSAKNQKYIQQIEASVRGASIAKAKQKEEEKKKKDDLMDLNKLFKPVQAMPKVAGDVDPKTVLCAFFKQGLCGKGNKCKYSHDLTVENKSAKRNLYVDSRDLRKEDEPAETNENWDEKQLNEVATKKHSEQDKKRPNQTEIVCKYFLDAVEENKYGWFWECPNGEKCIYRHALPPGYILKKDRKRLEELKKLETISLEELIEKERAQLSSANLTKVTLQSFIAWKKKKIMDKRKKAAEEEKQKKANARLGKQGGMSGRDLFTYNPDMVGEDDEEAQAGNIEREPDEQEEDVKAFEIDERTFYQIGEDGQMIDEDLPEEAVPETTENAQQGQPQVFDENLFADENIPDDDDDEDDENEIDEEDEENLEDEPGPSKTKEELERLKI